MAVGFDVVVPKLVALGVGITNVGTADPIYFAKRATVTERRLAQCSPVIPAATADHIVDGGERQLLVVEVTVPHDCWILRRLRNSWRQNENPEGSTGSDQSSSVLFVP